MHIITDENGNPIPHGGEHGHHHDHSHGHHDHAGEGCGHAENCGHADCTGCQDADPKQQLTALLNYMLQHNQSHAAELDQMAEKIRSAGMENAAEQIKKAVDEFQKGNMYLSLALSMVKENQ
ncbi:MAG: cobalt transporter [Candidatus Limivivens sp.]|nr:cobalt transporter [Candidatus Limivivens sp.]